MNSRASAIMVPIQVWGGCAPSQKAQGADIKDRGSKTTGPPCTMIGADMFAAGDEHQPDYPCPCARAEVHVIFCV